MLEEHQTKVSRSAKGWSGSFPGKEIPNFLHFVSETDLMDANVKTFSLPNSVPVLRGPLSEKTTNSDGQTALHEASRKDGPTRNKPEK